MPNMPEKLHCSRGGFGWSGLPCASAADAPAMTSATAAGATRAENLTRIIVELPSAHVPHHSAAAAAGAFVFVFISTASAIDVGIGLVFSVKLRTGMTMRKKAK